MGDSGSGQAPGRGRKTGPRKGSRFGSETRSEPPPSLRGHGSAFDSGDVPNPWRRAAIAIDKQRSRAFDKQRSPTFDPRSGAAIEGRGPQTGDGDSPSTGQFEEGAAGIEGGRRADGRFAIGRIGAPRGIEGDLHVHSYSGETSHFLALREVDLERKSAHRSKATSLKLRVDRVEEGSGGLTIAFEGYATREMAERLVGMEIIVDRALGAPLAEREWYVVDLVGLVLVSEDGKTRFGRVRAVCEGAADPMLEVLLEADLLSSDGRQCALVPFREEFVGDIDLQKGTVVLTAPWVLE